MADVTFDGTALVIKIAGLGVTDVRAEMYSAWKEWMLLTDNAKFPLAFETTGGDPISDVQEIAPYYFVRNDNGWRVEGPDANGEVTLDGNLYPKDPDTVLFTAASGFDNFIRLETSSRAIVEVTGTSGLTVDEAADLEQILKNTIATIGLTA